MPNVAKNFLIFVQRNIDAAKQARKSVRELDELFTFVGDKKTKSTLSQS